MGTLTLNDGTVLENSSAILSGDLFLYMNGHGLQEVFNLLINPNKTTVIIFTQVNGEEIKFTGFSRLISVRDEDNGLITAVLRKNA